MVLERMKVGGKMFQLKRPCKDCPFVKGSSTNMTLAEGRIEEIIDSLHADHIFSCHKTIDYNQVNPTDTFYQLQEQNQFCAGAMNYLVKEGRPNTQMQIATRLGWLNIDTLKGQENLIDVITMEMPYERALMQLRKDDEPYDE